MSRIHLLFGFRGRIGRATYWLAFLLFIMVDVVIALATALPFGVGPGEAIRVYFTEYGLYGGDAVVVLTVVAGLAMWLSALATGAKRLHDIGRSGWWMLLFAGVPYLCQVLTPDQVFIDREITVLRGIAAVIEVWFLVDVGLRRGSAGPNRFGPPPRGKGRAAPGRPPADRDGPPPPLGFGS